MISKYILFKISEKFFAIKLILVKEVILQTDIQKIPRASEKIKGVFNLRGKIIPVIDFSKILKITDCERENPNLIVLENQSGDKDFGFEVDEVVEVIKIDEGQLSFHVESSELLNHFTISAISNLKGHQDKIIYVLKDEFSTGIKGAA
jgi:purine-binding chemotaxis protein CheW